MKLPSFSNRCLTACLLAACPQALAATAAGPPPAVAASANLPPQSSCPAVANYDLRKIVRSTAAAVSLEPYKPDPELAEVVIPESAARRPPPDATFVIRVRLPSGGGYPEDERAVVWREADGSWWGWRKVVHGRPAMPPPPPAPGTPEAEQQARDIAAGYPWLYDSDPVFEGRLDSAQSARLEAAYSEPCRQLEPDRWPWEIPLLHKVGGSRRHKCQLYQDGTFYRAEFTEKGRPPRSVSMPCGSPGTLNGVLITWSAHAELPEMPARRLTREEIDALRRSGAIQ